MRNRTVMSMIILVTSVVAGQILAYLLNPAGYAAVLQTLVDVLRRIAFWGPIMAVLAGAFILITMRLLGFNSLDEIRTESVEQNNPAPAIVFVGTLIASLLLLSLVIRGG